MSSHTHTLSANQLPSHTHGSLVGFSDDMSHDVFMEVKDGAGKVFKISALDLAKQLNLAPETTAKPSKCYE